MQKIPYTFNLLLPTLSPAANLAVFEDTARGHNERNREKEIKAGSEERLQDGKVKHIVDNEVNNTGSETIIEVFVD